MYKQKIVKDSFWNILDYITTLAVFLITSKLIVDELGVDGYGFYMFFTSLIGTFGLVDLGMGMAVAKYLSEYFHHKKINEANQVITLAFTFYLSIGFVLFSVINFFDLQIINFLNFDNKSPNISSKVLLITSIIFIINMLTSVMINTLVALEEWKKISLINISSKILNAVLLILVLIRDISIEDKIYLIFELLLCFSIFKFLIHYIYVRSSFQELKLTKPEEIVKEKIMKFLKVSSFQYLLSLFTMHLDNFIVAKFFGLEAMGIYSFVRNAFFYLYGFLANIFKIFLPKLSKLHGDKALEELKRNFKKLLIYSLSTSIILALISIIFWKPFIGLYIDNKFAMNSFIFIQLFSIYLIARSAEPIFAYFFNAIAKPSILVVNLVLASASTVLGYLIFIPYFGIYGVILSQIIASIIVCLYNFYMIKQRGFDAFTK